MKARIAYAVLFCVVLPALLVAWAIKLGAVLALPAYGSLESGALVILAGLTLMALAMRDLWVHGGGLPASPFPPRRVVMRGAYALFAHPIYVGAVVVSVGVSLAARSAAGLWIVSPVLAIAAFAWVLGFERDVTLRHFGMVPQPRLSLPWESDEPLTGWERVAVYVKVFLPWLILFEAIEWLGVPPDTRPAYFAWDAALPVIPWTEALYASTYAFVLLAPIVADSGRSLRRFAIGGIVATAIVIPLYLLVPLVAEAKPVPGEGFWQSLMALERYHDQPVTAFPSFHVVWAFLAASLYAARWPRLRVAWWLFAAAQAVSCVTTGMHAAVDIAAGVAVYAVVAWREPIWRWLCEATERLANSWSEVSLGPVRFMGHGAYAGVGAAVGVIVAGTLAGAANAVALAGITLAAVFGAALWAQVVEGSPQLLRPYGYFGSVFMVIAVSVAAGLAGADAWLLFVAFGVGSCFTYAFGRMRCLVQGCCHGRESSLFLGIRYRHPMSRVVRLSALGGVPVHPTPLYSMMWMLFVGAVLVRLWTLAAPLQFIAGAYFVLVGLGRFVEEHFRGEPQTAVIGGLRLYQWLTLAFVVGGAVATTLGPSPAPAIPPFDPQLLPVAALVGVICYAAYGVDFPASSRRFSRLR